MAARDTGVDAGKKEKNGTEEDVAGKKEEKDNEEDVAVTEEEKGTEEEEQDTEQRRRSFSAEVAIAELLGIAVEPARGRTTKRTTAKIGPSSRRQAGLGYDDVVPQDEEEGEDEDEMEKDEEDDEEDEKELAALESLDAVREELQLFLRGVEQNDTALMDEAATRCAARVSRAQAANARGADVSLPHSFVVEEHSEKIDGRR